MDFSKSNKIESLQMSLRAYTYIADYLMNHVGKLEAKQQKSRKSFVKEINDTKRQLKKAELDIAFIDDNIKKISGTV